MVFKMKNIPKDDRPRERLMCYGAGSLSDIELLEIILKSGTKDNSIKDVASQLLNKIGDIKNFHSINYQMLSSISGIGKAKACSLLAINELSKRINQEYRTLNNVVIRDTSIAYEYFKSIFKNQKQEYFYCVYLDSKKRVISNKLLFMGTLNQSLVHPREIFKEAYLLSASSIICVHNHPSGNVEPSNEDIELTKRIYSIGILTGIRLVDHLIIGADKYYSFLENNLI